jgi:hypothetical protein
MGWWGGGRTGRRTDLRGCPLHAVRERSGKMNEAALPRPAGQPAGNSWRRAIMMMEDARAWNKSASVNLGLDTRAIW